MRGISLPRGALASAGIFLLSCVATPIYGQEAKQLYEQTCALCHGAEGKGDGPTSQVLKPRPANLTVVLKGKDDAYLTKLIREGGASVGKSPLMPSYQGVFNEEQIRGLIQYVKSFVAP
jgi:cytochrome c oxidase cbb3-type subunit 3